MMAEKDTEKKEPKESTRSEAEIAAQEEAARRVGIAPEQAALLEQMREEERSARLGKTP
jgi:hypothetical protein